MRSTKTNKAAIDLPATTFLLGLFNIEDIAQQVAA